MTPPPTLVKLPDGSYINPAHVVCIELEGGEAESYTAVKLRGRRFFTFPGDQRDTLAEHINNPHQL